MLLLNSRRYTDDFTTNYSSDAVDTLAHGFSDVYGSFALRPTSGSGSAAAATPPKQQQQLAALALTQVATADPDGCVRPLAPAHANPAAVAPYIYIISGSRPSFVAGFPRVCALSIRTSGTCAHG